MGSDGKLKKILAQITDVVLIQVFSGPGHI